MFEKLEAFLREAKACGLIKAVIVDGSFVTSKEAPSDVDLVLVVERNHDFSAELRPREYNVVSRRRVRQMFRFDVLVGRDGREDLAEHIEFFSRIRGDASIRKGMLRITL
ncbi:MAG TPA: hypothetical protein VMP01_11035 [Pirellulaceae bacterium]|nr:hypothetical protein [Pirellulaceae bacterium]